MILNIGKAKERRDMSDSGDRSWLQKWFRCVDCDNVAYLRTELARTRKALDTAIALHRDSEKRTEGLILRLQQQRAVQEALFPRLMHQLKNPLGIVNNAAFALSRMRPGDPQQSEQVQIMREEIQNMDDMMVQCARRFRESITAGAEQA